MSRAKLHNIDGTKICDAGAPLTTVIPANLMEQLELSTEATVQLSIAGEQFILFRKSHGSVTIQVPPAIVEMIRQSADPALKRNGLDWSIMSREPSEDSRHRPRYTLSELLAECDANAPLTQEDREWIDGSPAGNEIL